MSWLFPEVKNTSMTGNEVKAYMKPVQDLIGQQQGTVGQMQGAYGQSMGFARDMMDPMSVRNVQQRQMMQSQGADNMALQNLLARRQAASMGQESGITQSQQRQSAGQMGRDLNQQYQQMLNQQYMQGLGQFNQAQGLLGSIGSMQSGMGTQQLGIQENIAQAEIARKQMDMQIAQEKANRRSQFWGGIIGGVAGGFAGNAFSAGGMFGKDLPIDPTGGSDIALKENIDLIGQSPSGINIYEFDYKDKLYGDGRYRGVMAQEVPNASFKHKDGYLWVDYNKVDVAFERID